ncbi:MAG: acyltransferase family protein [Bradymonadaceae bacterium]|nr:acyltransferase family protein [Lujinxingiaceae bacterium]
MPTKLLTDDEVLERVKALEIPFNRYGLDPYGISQEHLAQFFTMLGWLYRHYFRVRTFGIENVPARGRAMVVGNHSGGLPVDGAMILTSLLLEMDPPRLGQGMVEKFASRWPFVSHWFSRVGQLTGLPEHAERLLEDDRLLMVFPEGARGTGKLYRDKYKLVRFGTGFVRLALKTKTPIVPFAFIGGEEAIPTVFHLKRAARLLGVPYIPVAPYLLPIPMPIKCQIFYGEAMTFEGDGTEDDEVIEGYVDAVQERIRELIEQGRVWRRHELSTNGHSV